MFIHPSRAELTGNAGERGYLRIGARSDFIVTFTPEESGERVYAVQGAIVRKMSAADVAPQQTDSSANARLRALYTAEWSWRQRELAGSDRFARVDAESLQRRLTYLTLGIALLDRLQ